MARPRSRMLMAALLSIIALLSWWRASQGLSGWTEMSTLWSLAAVIAWVFYLRARRRNVQ